MTKIKPKLYLNNSPQTTEEGSLAFARNMKIDDDGNLVSDYGAEIIDAYDSRPTPKALSTYNIIGHIVGLDNKVYFFTDDDSILEYDELTKSITNGIFGYWSYSGGKIYGCVSTNISGEKILTIGESFPSYVGLVPLKHINLSHPNTDEILCTQAPEVPIANLIIVDTYVKTIPSGVYVFFIRYKIRKDVYTPWYLCSRPIFGGTNNTITTIQGGLKYINLHKDSAKSFKFSINFINKGSNNYIFNSYSEFQLGFIITHDEATDARIWKSFSMSTTSIYFDYEDVQDTNIDDLLATTYELYNVGNITNFKNKLYISNYKETNFKIDTEVTDIINAVNIKKVYYDYGSTINYKDFYINNHKLDFDYNVNYYTKGNYSIDDLFGSSLDSNFNTAVSKLIKFDTREQQDILKFDIGWNADLDPDLCFVYNIYNNAYNFEVFGEPWEVDYETAKTYLFKEQFGDFWICEPTSQLHPWYGKNLTFVYSSLPGAIDVSEGESRNKVFFFRKDTKHYKGNPTATNVGWPAENRGFDDFARSAIVDNITKEITNCSFFAIAYIEITYGAKTYQINRNARTQEELSSVFARINRKDYIGYDHDLDYINYSNFTTGTPGLGLSSKIKNYIYYNLLYDYIVGFTEAGVPIVNISSLTGDTSDVIPVTAATVVLKKFDFSVEFENVKSDVNNYFEHVRVSLVTTDYTSVCNFSMKTDSYKKINSVVNYEQLSTLMPLSKYQAYIHFVDSSNIIYNGIKFGEPIETDDDEMSTYRKLIKLQYKYTGNAHDKYKGFFISLVNIGPLVAECFGYVRKGDIHIVNCIEADTLLYNVNDNISVYFYDDQNGKTLITDKAKYYSSGDSSQLLAFGNVGYISWYTSDIESGVSNFEDKPMFIEISRDKTEEKVSVLTKASAYIPLTNQTNFVDLPDGYYGAYACVVKKPDFELASRCYVAGNDIYSVDREVSLELKDFNSYIQIQDSTNYFIRSNFNLNYLSLTEDVNDKIFSIGGASSGVKEVARVINSATLSYIYELKSMYKDFMNKTFISSNGDYKSTFDNTIRVSNVLSDETFNNSVFRFKSEDYYNVPTDRGIIVNLFSIGSNMYVHTKGSLYKFDANQTITASNSDITLQETEPFTAGITQILDSQYGYGGIENKEAGCITFDSYFFYDRFSNHIFAYAGNGQIQIIDASIYKVLNYYKPDLCYTLHDDSNHRVLFNFKKDDANLFTISFNYKSRTFVSIHDINLINSFAGKLKSYSYISSASILFSNIYTLNFVVIDRDLNLYNIYGLATEASIINIDKIQSSPFNIAVVVFPQNNIRESIDSIKFIGEVIKPFIEEESIEHESVDEGVYSTFWDNIKIPEHYNMLNPVENLVIISDTCISNTVTGTVDDTNRPESLKGPEVIPNGLLDYKGFKHAIDSWNANYFRDIKNNIDIYNYPDQPRENQPINSDNNSLVYGKYFILIFNFIKDKPIKIEELFVNTQKY